MKVFELKYVIAYIALFATVVFNTLAVVFINSKLSQNNIHCAVPENATLQETFYNNVLDQILPLVIGLHVISCLTAITVAIIASFVNLNIYTYHFICLALFCSPLLLAVPIMTMAINHALYHAVTELGKTYDCSVNFFFAHKIILPFSINGIAMGMFTVGYFIFYLLLYNNRFCFDSLYTPTLLLNTGAIDALQLDEDEHDILGEVEADMSTMSSEL